MRISDWSSDVCSSDLGWGFETDPAKAAADAFKQELGKRGITVTGGAQRTVAPPSTEVAPADEEAESAEEAPDGLTPGTELAAVNSAPVWQIGERVLAISENEGAELPATHVAIDRGDATSLWAELGSAGRQDKVLKTE